MDEIWYSVDSDQPECSIKITLDDWDLSNRYDLERLAWMCAKDYHTKGGWESDNEFPLSLFIDENSESHIGDFHIWCEFQPTFTAQMV